MSSHSRGVRRRAPQANEPVKHTSEHRTHRHHNKSHSPGKPQSRADQLAEEAAWIDAVRTPNRVRFVPHTVLVERDIVVNIPVQEAIERAFAEAHIRDEVRLIDDSDLFELNGSGGSSSSSAAMATQDALPWSLLTRDTAMTTTSENTLAAVVAACRRDPTIVNAQVPHGADADATDRVLGAKTYIPYTIRIQQRVAAEAATTTTTTSPSFAPSNGDANASNVTRLPPRSLLRYVQPTANHHQSSEDGNHPSREHSLSIAVARLMHAYEQAPGGPARLLAARKMTTPARQVTFNDHLPSSESLPPHEVFHSYVRQLLPILLPTRFARLPLWQQQQQHVDDNDNARNNHDESKNFNFLKNDVVIAALSFNHFHKLMAKQELAQRTKRLQKVKSRCARCGAATYTRATTSGDGNLNGNDKNSSSDTICATCAKRSNLNSHDVRGDGRRRRAALATSISPPTPVNPATATYADYFGHDPTSGTVQSELGIIPNDGHPEPRACFPFHFGFVFGVVIPVWSTRWTENLNLVIVPNAGNTLDQVAQQFGFLSTLPLMGTALVICNGGSIGSNTTATQSLNGLYLFAGLINTNVQVGPNLVPTTCFLLRPARFNPLSLVPIAGDNVIIQLGACEGMWVIDTITDQTCSGSQLALDCSTESLAWLVHKSIWQPPVLTTLVRQMSVLVNRSCGACRRPFTHCTCSQQDAARRVHLSANNSTTAAAAMTLSSYNTRVLPQPMTSGTSTWPSPWLIASVEKREEEEEIALTEEVKTQQPDKEPLKEKVSVGNHR